MIKSHPARGRRDEQHPRRAPCSAPRTAVQGIWAPSRQPRSYKGIFFPFSSPSWRFNTNLAAAAGTNPAGGLRKAENFLSLLCPFCISTLSPERVSAPRELFPVLLHSRYVDLEWQQQGFSGFSCSVPCFALFQVRLIKAEEVLIRS